MPRRMNLQAEGHLCSYASRVQGNQPQCWSNLLVFLSREAMSRRTVAQAGTAVRDACECCGRASRVPVYKLQAEVRPGNDPVYQLQAATWQRCGLVMLPKRCLEGGLTQAHRCAHRASAKLHDRQGLPGCRVQPAGNAGAPLMRLNVMADMALHCAGADEAAWIESGCSGEHGVERQLRFWPSHGRTCLQR